MSDSLSDAAFNSIVDDLSKALIDLASDKPEGLTLLTMCRRSLGAFYPTLMLGVSSNLAVHQSVFAAMFELILANNVMILTPNTILPPPESRCNSRLLQYLLSKQHSRILVLGSEFNNVACGDYSCSTRSAITDLIGNPINYKSVNEKLEVAIFGILCYWFDDWLDNKSHFLSARTQRIDGSILSQHRTSIIKRFAQQLKRLNESLTNDERNPELAVAVENKIKQLGSLDYLIENGELDEHSAEEIPDDADDGSPMENGVRQKRKVEQAVHAQYVNLPSGVNRLAVGHRVHQE